jgi:hypothetical protein
VVRCPLRARQRRERPCRNFEQKQSYGSHPASLNICRAESLVSQRDALLADAGATWAAPHTIRAGRRQVRPKRQSRSVSPKCKALLEAAPSALAVAERTAVLTVSAGDYGIKSRGCFRYRVAPLCLHTRAIRALLHRQRPKPLLAHTPQRQPPSSRLFCQRGNGSSSEQIVSSDPHKGRARGARRRRSTNPPSWGTGVEGLAPFSRCAVLA